MRKCNYCGEQIINESIGGMHPSCHERVSRRKSNPATYRILDNLRHKLDYLQLNEELALKNADALENVDKILSTFTLT